MTTGNSNNTNWDIRKVMEEIRELYVTEKIDQYWENERDAIERRVRSLDKCLSGRYVNATALGVGGSGIVLKFLDSELSGHPCAGKFPRPIAGQVDLLGDMLDEEISHLTRLRHGCVVRILGRGEIDEYDIKGAHFLYYIMDYVEGDKSSRYLRDNELNENQFVRIVESTIEAIAYLHENATIHFDIKPGNIFIDGHGLPVIADLGTAKSIKNINGHTRVACTLGYADPDVLSQYLGRSGAPSDPNRVRGQIPRRDLDLKWDFHPLGKTILEWLGYDFEGKSIPRRLDLSSYARKYLLLMAARLLRGRIDIWLEERVGLDRKLLNEMSYSDTRSVMDDIHKLSGKYSIVELVPELNSYRAETLQVAVDGPTSTSPRVRELLDHPSVRRLASITQLGVIGQVYPTATHSRLEHTMGTYHNVCRYILSLYYDPLGPLFRQMINASDICVVLASALLHDVGQYPLGHELEEIDDTMFSHKRLTKAVIQGVRNLKKAGAKRIDLQSFEMALKKWGVSVNRVIQVLEADVRKDGSSIKDRILHSIIDGPIDADKMDYLRRDSRRLGVPYGNAIDLERVLRSLTVIVGHDERKKLVACIGVHEKAKVAAEFVAIARHAMFSQVYWHHTVRSMKGMLARAVLKLSEILNQKGDKERNEFRSSFENFVLLLPSSLHERLPIQSSLFTSVGHEPHDIGYSFEEIESTISETDAAVILFLRTWLRKLNAPESELLDDLSIRKLYKRLFVFSKERSPYEWSLFANKWDSLSPRQKLDVYKKMEDFVLESIQERSQSEPPTISLDAERLQSIEGRVRALRPLILFDIPGDRPGADIPLYYVLEGQRRTLRKDERSMGDLEASSIWIDFATKIRERAGKARVFCHPLFVDALESAISKEKFIEHFEKAIESTKSSKSTFATSSVSEADAE